jgi:hypothetical protein
VPDDVAARAADLVENTAKCLVVSNGFKKVRTDENFTAYHDYVVLYIAGM